MKKSAILCMLLALLLLLSACQSKEAKEAEALIEAIGTVTLDSGDAIQAAEQAVANMQSGPLKEVQNLETLNEARSTYNVLAAEDAISHIGTVTLDSYEAISAAEEAVSSLTAAEYMRVSNIDVYNQAKADYEKAEADYEKAKAESEVAYINSAIADIGTVTLQNGADYLGILRRMKSLDEEYQAAIVGVDKLVRACNTYYALQVEESIDKIGSDPLSQKSAVKSARKAYDGADPEVQALVKNYYVLESAEKQIQAAKDAEKAATTTSKKTCDYCNGTGKVVVKWYSEGDWGEVSYSSYKCTQCNGKGYR